MQWARPGQGGGEAGFFALVQQVLVGPVAAFFMFTSSTGNIPLAAVLYSSGVAFAGVMAFAFSDLVVFPVLRVNAAYYGWKMALYIMGMLLASLVGTSLLTHGGLVLVGLLPEGEAARMAEQAFFKIDYTFFLNIAFLVISVLMAGLYWNQRSGGHARGGEIPGSAFVSSPTRTAPLSSTRFHLLPSSPMPEQPVTETASLLAVTKRPRPARGSTSGSKKCAWTTSVRSSGGTLAAGAALGGAGLVGAASGAEARLLLETAMPRVRSFCGTVTILLGNVLALMLTLLSMSKGTDVELKWAHYQRVKQIAFIDAVTLIAAVLIYLVLNFPLADADAAQQAGYTRWYAGVYYVVLALVSLLGGALISVVLMLYNAVRDVIQALGPDRDESSFVRSEEAAQEAKRQAYKAQEEAQEARNQAP